MTNLPLTRDSIPEELITHLSAIDLPSSEKDVKGAFRLVGPLYRAAVYGPWAVFSACYDTSVSMSQAFVVSPLCPASSQLLTLFSFLTRTHSRGKPLSDNLGSGESIESSGKPFSNGPSQAHRPWMQT
jgi:hypothetical protein